MKKYFIALFLVFVSFQSFAQEKFVQEGLASFYADRFEGRTTASGEKFAQDKFTAAHLSLPFGTRVKVTNLENQKHVEVKINDRGPFIHGRIIDLSKVAAEELQIFEKGIVKVKIEVLEYPQNTTFKTPVPEKKEEEKKESPKEEIEEEKPIKEEDTPVVAAEKLYYQVSSKEISPQGYGVQIGSFKEMANLLKRLAEIQSNVTNEITVQVAQVNEARVYRIVIGKFDEKKQAVTLQEKLKESFPGCYVVSF